MGGSVSSEDIKSDPYYIGNTAGVCVASSVSSEDIKSDPYTTETQKSHLVAEKSTIEDFYKAQSYQELGSEQDRVRVPIWISHTLDAEWKKWLLFGIKQINIAAPGLHLFRTNNKSKAAIHVLEGKEPARAFTKGNIITTKDHVEIHLGGKKKGKKRTATHEMLHALGFKHEHQRSDASKSINTAKTRSNQVLPKDNIIGLTRFDPFSILMYSERKRIFSRSKNDPVWKLKNNKSRNVEMSELDKVGLNLLYRPCTGPHYKPKVSLKTGMLYCGREVMERHNFPYPSVTKRCGPETSANCPACRTINTPKVQELRKMGKWQGWSGLVYCGKKFFGQPGPDHNGFCGPNAGPPCPECWDYLHA